MRLWRALGLGLGVATGAGLARPAPPPVEPPAPRFTEAERVAARAFDTEWLRHEPYRGDGECGTYPSAVQRPREPRTPVELDELEALLGAPTQSAATRAQILEQLAIHSGLDRWRFWTSFEKRPDFVDADVPMIVDGLQTSASYPHLVATYLGDRLGSAAWARAALQRRGQHVSKPSDYWPVLTPAQFERLTHMRELGVDRPSALTLLR